MKKQPKRGRPAGTLDDSWPARMMMLLGAIVSIQRERHTVSMRELCQACGVSRQTIVNWLKVAEELDYVDRHNGQPRALQMLPAGQKLVRRFESLQGVDDWRAMRKTLEGMR